MISKIDKREMQDFIKKHKIKHVRVMFPDLTWCPRGKIVSATYFLKHLDGLQLPEEATSMAFSGDVVYQPGSVSGVEGNMIGVPDARTLVKTPWLEDTAQVIVKLFTAEGEPYMRDPRRALEDIFNRFLRKNMLPRIGIEIEGYLFKGDQPATKHCESDRIAGLSEIQDFISLAFSYAEQMDVDVNTFHHETAPGQIEMALQHKYALRAADELFYFKEALQEAARQLGYTVALMPRVSRELSPSGCHLHLSIQDKRGTNLFVKNGKETPLMTHALAGILEHLRAGCAFYLPTINAYKRIDPTQWTPINVSWAHDNRWAAVRVSKKNDKGKNIENRVPGMDINPHLAIATLLASAYLGIQAKKTPQKETKGSPYKDKTLKKLPRDLLASLEFLKEDPKLSSLIGTELVNLYIALKEIEHREYSLTVTPWETDLYGP